MNRSSTRSLFLFLFAFFSCLWSIPYEALGQTKALGEISGKVIDETGSELPGATIVVKSADSTTSILGASTEVNGKFNLTNVPLGRQVLVASFVGYSNTEVTVNVQQGILVNLTIRLQPAASELAEVVVRGSAEIRYSSIRNSTDLQLLSAIKFSEGILTGISNEQIAKSADRDASQIVQRISGVSLVDRFVVVRGMDPRYNLTMVNGIIGPSSEENSRAFSYDALPTGVIDRIELEKSPGPHLPAMWGGGVVKIYTRNFAQARQFNFDFTGGYRTGGSSFNDQFITYDAGNKDWFANGAKDRRLPAILRQKYFEYPSFDQYPAENIAIARSGLTPYKPKKVSQDFDKRMNMSYYDSWKIGKFRLNSLTAASYTLERLYQETTQQRDAARYDSIGTSDTEGSFGVVRTYLDSTRRSDGVLFYRTTPTLYAKDSLFEEQVRISAVQSFGLQINDNNNVSATLFYNRFGTDQVIIRKGYEDLAGVGDVLRDDAIPNQLQYTYSYEQREIVLGQLGGSHQNGSNNFDWTVGYSRTKNEVPDLQQFAFTHVSGDQARILTGYDFEGNKTYATFLVFETEERSVTGRVDYKHEFNEGFYVRAGGLFDRRERSFFSYRYIPVNVAQGSSNLYETDPLKKPWEVMDSVFSPQNFSADAWNLEYPSRQGGAYFFDDESAEGYLSVNYPVIKDRLTFYGGARIARFSRTLFDKYYKPTLDSASVGGRNIKVPDRVKIYYLPSAMLKYSFKEGKYIVRAVYGQSVDRPQFREQAGASSVEPGSSPEPIYNFRTNESLLGNPGLENTLIHNVDLRFEYYPKGGEFISVGAFYKYMDKPIQRIATDQAGSAARITYENGKYATVRGVELEFRKKLDFLAIPILRDISLNINGSYIWSESTVNFTEPPEPGEEPLILPDVKYRLQGASPFLINAALYYENLENGLLLSAIYNLTWDRVRDYSTDEDFGNLVEGRRHQLDLVLKKRLTNYLTFKASVQDLLNQTQRFYRDQNANYAFDSGINNAVAIDPTGRVWRGDFAERELRPGAYFTLGVSLTLQNNNKNKTD